MRGKHRNQSGNIIVAIFAAIAAVGVLGVVTMNTIQGPVRTMSEVTKRTIADNDMVAATVLISEASLALANADCDADGVIEPIPFQDAGVYDAPMGGGIIPMNIGAKRTDPWGNPYGYCVWDDGITVHDDACGGADANRLAGGNTTTAPVIAIISSGPDRIFQTTCSDYIDEETHTVVRDADSDDMMHVIPYGQFLLPSRARAQLEDLPEEACYVETIGTLRMTMGLVQVCTDVGWSEVGTAAFTDSNFEPVVNGILNQQYTSNAISFAGFLNQRTVEVTEGNATLVINGTVVGRTANIRAGDTIALRATSAPVPETTYTYAISVSGVRKVWSIRTRNFTPAQLTITPTTKSMAITTAGSPGYGAPSGFVVRNVGETATGPMLSSQLSNTTNFQFHAGGGFVGDGCAMQNLTHDQTCVIDIRPRAHAGGSYAGTVTARTSSTSVVASINLSASGWECDLPWGGTIAHGDYVDAYASNSVTCGAGCQRETRTCTNGVLSGSYQNASCNPTGNCTYSWQTGNWTACPASSSWTYGAWGACSASCGSGTQSRTASCSRPTGTQTRSLSCVRSDGTTANQSLCPSGSRPTTSQTCTAPACTGSAQTSRACNTHACPQGYVTYNNVGVSGYPTCPAHWSQGVRCSPITHYVPTGSPRETWQAQTSTCQICADVCSGFICNANPKVLCGYFNAIGLLPDHIYAADVRYAQQFISGVVNRGYRLWAEPLTTYLEKNPDSILIPILRPLVVGWAEEMAYRMGEIEQSNWIGRILIRVGTPISSGLGWLADTLGSEKKEVPELVEG